MNYRNQNSERGATLLEFTFCLLGLVAFLGLAFDTGLGIYRSNLLNYTVATVATVARTLAAELPVERPLCDEIPNTVTEEGVRYFTETLGFSPDLVAHDLAFSSSIDDTTPRPTLTITASWNLPCFFFCPLVSGGLQTSVRALTVIESDRYCI